MKTNTVEKWQSLGRAAPACQVTLSNSERDINNIYAQYLE